WRSFGVAISVIAFGTYLMLRAVPAQAAAFDCTYDSVNRQVNFVNQGGDSVIGVAGGDIVADDDDSLAEASQCGIATVNNTDGINIDADSTLGLIVIDLSGGQLAPGETPEASGTSEIEIDVFNGNDSANLQVNGTTGADNIVWGDGGTGIEGDGAINLNGDND